MLHPHDTFALSWKKRDENVLMYDVVILWRRAATANDSIFILKCNTHTVFVHCVWIVYEFINSPPKIRAARSALVCEIIIWSCYPFAPLVFSFLFWSKNRCCKHFCIIFALSNWLRILISFLIVYLTFFRS